MSDGPEDPRELDPVVPEDRAWLDKRAREILTRWQDETSGHPDSMGKEAAREAYIKAVNELIAYRNKHGLGTFPPEEFVPPAPDETPQPFSGWSTADGKPPDTSGF